MAAAEKAGGLTHVSLQRQVTGTYYIGGELTGYGSLDFLVDTGSSFLVINERILEKLQAEGAAHFSRDLDGLMANGARMTVPLYRLSGLRLGGACWIEDVEAAVFPQATRPIVGMNVLTRFAPFTFAADPPALILNDCESGAGAALTAKAETAPAKAAAP